ncbi:MAG: HD-GYP domain-containing protein [Defluviitaleaceae bacterium]|nr:HD-GYP domain-containing protein [Defluviitaleaceae bacterium]
MYRFNINLEELEKGMVIAEPVFAITKTGTNMLLIKEDTLVTDKIISLLQRQQVKQIVVNTRKKLRENLPLVQSKIEEKPKVKPIFSDTLRKEAVENIRSLFSIVNDPDHGNNNMTTAYQAIEGLDRILNQLIASISAEPGGIVHIHDLKSFDEYTYHHSLSVAVLAIATGQVMGMDLLEIIRLSRCAVLHDVGKLAIPIEILNKRSSLTDEEFKIMKSHSVQSSLNLKNKAFGDTELWTGVMYHHEKVNGKGYPKGLTGNEIPLFSRIISVADVYDAITSYRPYRKPMTPSDARELIMGEVGNSFEYDIVKAFTKKLVLYPLNTIVELSNHTMGVVIENENQMRPVVKLENANEVIDLSNHKNLNIVITKVINPNEKSGRRG